MDYNMSQFKFEPSEQIIDCNELISNNLDSFVSRYHNIALWMGCLVLASVVLSWLNKGEIKLATIKVITIPEKYTLSDTAYIGWIKALNVGYVGIACILLFPLW